MALDFAQLPGKRLLFAKPAPVKPRALAMPVGLATPQERPQRLVRQP